MSEEICYTPAFQLAEMVRQKALSPVEVVQAHLDRIEELNPKLNAVVIFPREDPLALAREAEAAVLRGDALGPLHGVPFTLKDCIETAGLRMTLGSRLLADNVSQQDAVVYTRLRRAGGILLGKTNMPEFALWWETGNLVFGLTRNPWNLDYTAGGSSGGEASAVAGGLSPLGLGTDLGGSIREPSSFCGLVGLKPTIGRVPYTGIQPQVLFRSIHVGPMARNVRDAALALSVLAGPDDQDPYAMPVPVADYLGALDQGVSGLRLGFSPTAGIAVDPQVQRTVREAASALAGLGMQVEEVEIPGLAEKDAGEISAVVFNTEAGFYASPAIAGREGELTEVFRRRFVDTPTPPHQEYLEASAQWEALKKDVREYFSQFDLFLAPTTPMPAFPHGQTEFNIEGQALAGRHALRGTVPWDLTGSPAVSVPFGWTADGLPLAVQLVGRHYSEATLLQAAHALEGTRQEQRRPSL